jgi:hypothetical protein
MEIITTFCKDFRTNAIDILGYFPASRELGQVTAIIKKNKEIPSLLSTGWGFD